MMAVRSTTAMWARVGRGLRYFVVTRADATSIGVLAALSFVGATLEAAALGLIAPTALAIVSGDERVVQEISFITLDADVKLLVLVIAGLLLGSGFFQFGQSWVRATLMTRIETERRRQIVEAFVKARWERAAESAEGSLQQIVGYVTHTSAGVGSLAEFTKAVTSFAVMVLLAVFIDPRAALGIVIVVTVLGALLYPFSRKLARENRELAQISMEQSELIGEIRRTIRDITVFRSRDHYLTEFDQVQEQWRRHRRRASVLNNVSRPVYQYIGLFAVVIGLFLLAIAQDDGGAAPASVSALLLIRSISYGQNVQSQVQSLYGALPYAQMAHRHHQELKDAAWPTREADIAEASVVELADVTYRYPGGTVPAIEGVSISVDLHESIGLVGPSGSGKSTLAQVLLGLRAPTSGRLMLGQTDAGDVSLDAWFQYVSYVPQAPVIIRGSLRSNVSMHRADVGDDDVERALVEAGLSDLLDELAGDLDAPLGPGGRDLSGGQIQRLGIARALAGSPRLVILDEPTSALDLTTESIIQATLGQLKGRVGLVIIAHRLSTLAVCDRLVVLEHGKVSFDGPTDEAFSRSEFLRSARQHGILEVS